MNDPKTRFTDKARFYSRYRPGYPADLIRLLKDECNLGPTSFVADIGAGTGILCQQLLSTGARVVAVEPNDNMLEVAKESLDDREDFFAVSGSAEDTGLKDKSVDMITVAQAFHWFDFEPSRKEFQRILKPGGWVVIIWNERRTDEGFGADYERFLHEHAIDYGDVDHRRITDEQIADFLKPGEMRRVTLRNKQHLDLEGVEGRFLSASYAPGRDHPAHEGAMKALRDIYHKHGRDGEITMHYNTRVFYAQW